MNIQIFSHRQPHRRLIFINRLVEYFSLVRVIYLSRVTFLFSWTRRYQTGNRTRTLDMKTNCKASVPPFYLTGIFLTLCVTLILTAAVGNTLICMAVYKKGALRTSPNYVLVSLSLASLMYVPVLINYAISLTMSECQLTTKILCRWTSHLDIVLFCVVMLHLLVISLDRLLTIKMPMRYVMLYGYVPLWRGYRNSLV